MTLCISCTFLQTACTSMSVRLYMSFTYIEQRKRWQKPAGCTHNHTHTLYDSLSHSFHSLSLSLSFSLSLALLQRVINLINFNMLQQQQFNKCASHTLGQSYRKHAALRINGWRRAKRQQLSNLRKKRLVSLNYFRYAQIRSNMLR